MRALIATAVLLCSATCFADTYYYEEPPRRRVVIEPRYAEPRPFLREPGWEWRAAHRERNAGMAMTIVGIPLAIASTALAVWAPTAPDRYQHDQAVGAAIVSGVAAGLLIIPGIPIWADGQARINALEGRRLTLQGGPAGSMGSTLALAF